MQAFGMKVVVFNLVSSVVDDVPHSAYVGEAGLVLLSRQGILLEIELLFSKPIRFQDYPIIKSNQMEQGLPIFNMDAIEESYPETILYIEKAANKALLLFSPLKGAVDLIVVFNNVYFLINNRRIVGIEILNITLDYNDQKQIIWLEKKAPGYN